MRSFEAGGNNARNAARAALLMIGLAPLAMSEAAPLGDPLPTIVTIADVYPSISFPGQDYFIVFNVSADSGTPPGSVEVTGSSGESCGPVDLADGWGGCVLQSADAGSRTLTVAYVSSDPLAFESNSATVVHDVDARATTISLDALMPETSVTGQPVDVFYSIQSLGLAGGDALVSATTGESCTAGIAVGTCAITFAHAGVRDVSVAYLGDIDHDGSTSASLNHVVERAATSIDVATFPAEPVVGESVAFAVDVVPVGFGAGVASGTVSVSSGDVWCDATLVDGSGVCTLTPDQAGEQTFALAYSGDDDFLPAKGSALTFVAHPLVALDDDFAAIEDTALIVDAANGVLANDSGPEGVTLTVTSAGTFAANGIGGTVTLAADGSFGYAPPPDANGDASFDYVVAAGEAALTATATIHVAAVNDAPSFALSGSVAWPPGESGVETENGFADVLAFGPADEDGQHVLAWKIRVLDDPNGVISNPSIALDGALSYGLTGNSGTATLGVVLQDDGGTANGGIDVAPQQTFAIAVGGGADLSIAIDDGRTAVDEGDVVVYSIVVTNFGPDAVTGADVSDVLPATLASAAWTCSPQPGTACAPSGSGDIEDTIDLPAGASVEYHLTAVVAATGGAPIANTVSVTPPADVSDWVPDNNVAIDVDGAGIFVGGFD